MCPVSLLHLGDLSLRRSGSARIDVSVLGKDASTGRGGRNGLFNKWYINIYKRMNLDSFLTPQTKINLKCFTHLHMRTKIIELLEVSKELIFMTLR